MERIISTRYGKLAGRETDDAVVYMKVPYARPPVGDWRFHAPEKPDAWDGVRDATQFPSASAQIPRKSGSFYEKEFSPDPEKRPVLSEDSLYLNIWTPKEAKEPCPVAVWIHGGAFTGGYPAEMQFDGDAYAKRGVILVTVAYRLGIFGFFCHEELRARDGHSGNYGLMDQIAALDWVRENIAAFGGDPENITLFGQSAGAMSVRALCTSPLTKGKIRRAILQSGTGYGSPMKATADGRQMEEVWKQFLAEQSLTLAQLMQMDTAALLEIQQKFAAYSVQKRGVWLPFTPVVDGYVLPMTEDEAAEQGLSHAISYMAGATKDDMGVDPQVEHTMESNALLAGLAAWCAMHAARGTNNYVYYFGRDLPGDEAGAFHSSELWYMFGTLSRCWRPMEARDDALSESMLDAWTAFMKTGDPGWPAYRKTGGFIRDFE